MTVFSLSILEYKVLLLFLKANLVVVFFFLPSFIQYIKYGLRKVLFLIATALIYILIFRFYVKYIVQL